jgi:hypothetical protein
MVTRKLNERRHKRVILRSEATKDPCAPRRNRLLLGAQGSFASLRMTTDQ